MVFHLRGSRELSVLVLHNPAANDASWASSYMDPDSVCHVDEKGNVYAKLSIHGGDYLVLHSCFVGAVESRDVVRQFLESGTPTVDMNWVPSTSVPSKIYQG